MIYLGIGSVVFIGDHKLAIPDKNTMHNFVFICIIGFGRRYLWAKSR
jgi:hypothetical protein